MLEYDRIDVSEGIEKKCDICHYWHILDRGFKYEPYLAMVVMI